MDTQKAPYKENAHTHAAMIWVSPYAATRVSAGGDSGNFFVSLVTLIVVSVYI